MLQRRNQNMTGMMRGLAFVDRKHRRGYVELIQ